MTARAERRRHALIRRMTHAESLHKAGKIAEAVTIYRDVILREPTFPPALYLSGIAAYQLRELDKAKTLFEAVIRLAPRYADAYYNLGLVVQECGQLPDSIDCYQRAIHLQPDHSSAWVNIGTALLALGRRDEAIEAFDRAERCPMPAAESRLNRAFAKMIMGRWPAAWDDYEGRWDSPVFRVDYDRGFAQPRWDGNALNGRHLLLWAEQGFGDTIMTLRYLPLVRQDGGATVTLEVQPALAALVRANVGDVAVLGRGDTLPPFDVQLPLMSLPHVFRTSLETVPALTVRAPSRECAIPKDVRNIGLTWAGAAKHRNDRNRSIALPTFDPLFSLPHTRWFALQVERLAGIERTSLHRLPLNDFADTAAVIAQLDLVITTDTAVAHLAGALGTPTSLLLSAWPDARWLLDRTDTPWYPSVTLYRQPVVGDWHSVVRRLQADLA